MKLEIISPDFNHALKDIFERYPLEALPEATKENKPMLESVDAPDRIFNVIKETEDGQRVVAFGLDIKDVFRGIDGRYKDTETVKFHVIPSEIREAA